MQILFYKRKMDKNFEGTKKVFASLYKIIILLRERFLCKGEFIMRVQQRVEALREIMGKRGLDAYIIPTSGPHHSEYTAECWQFRSWLSGFKGSAGTIVVTLSEAGLWTDGRYYIEAENVLRGTGIDLYKAGLPETPDYPLWLSEKLNKGMTIGIDGKTFSLSGFKAMKKHLAGINISSISGIMDELWTDRPKQPNNPVVDFDTKYAGLSREEKLYRVRELMRSDGVDFSLIATLADIAWLFNLRGTDIDYNPVFLSYCIVAEDKAYLFITPSKISRDLKAELNDSNIEIHNYDEIEDFLKTLSGTLSPDGTSKWLYDLLPRNLKVHKKKSDIAHMKAQKNAIEISSLRDVMIKDGTALVNFFFWLESAVNKEIVTEISVSQRLKEFRAAGDDFIGESFPAVAGFREHGAIIHYKSDESTDIKLESPGLLLLDSGGQYIGGTTDITRMVLLGSPSAAEVTDYTLVLKGLIALSRIEFPSGTRGYQLDVLARKELWDRHLNYNHGTGHGVGFYLNVHEGPQRISPHPVDIPLEPGMITSNEPGIYREGKYGIRIENLILTVEKEETEFGKFLGFETLSLCPFETRLIDKELLDQNEISWLNDYHRTVYSKLVPHLGEEQRIWLMEKTGAI